MARIKPQDLLQQSKKKKAPSRISLSTIIFFSLVVLLLVFFIFSTYRHFSNRPTSLTEEVQAAGRKGLTKTKKHDVPGYVILSTSKGSLTVELFKKGSMEVVDEFIALCQKGHFKGMPFHRVIKHYVIQAGYGPSVGTADDWTSRSKHYSQLDKSIKHEAFMFGTSKSKKDGKGFDLYITTAPIPDLNEKITVFGRVVKGEDVVQEIEEVDTNEHYVPISPIGIIDVTLQPKI